MRKVAITGAVAMLASLLMVVSMVGTAAAALPGSNFEIDTDANLKVDGTAPPALDWANVNETRQEDTDSGPTDESFTQGTKEDTAVPTIETGGIPPNKSDLLTFGSYLETNATGAKFLNIFWHRVQEPQGTTNMDFEFNKSSVLSANGVTPVRSDGDILIMYDLSQGGTNPTLWLSRWILSGTKNDCEANGQSPPCWADRINLTTAGDAVGSINTSAIPAAESDGLGDISPRTFGEAQIDFSVFAGTGCVGFGSAYLKSRSSDSFTAALKDFIPPVALDFNECGAIKVTKTKKHEADPGTTPIPDAGVTFTLSGNGITPVTAVTGADGVACFDGVAIDPVNAYTVTESVPDGYVSNDSVQEVVVNNAASCTATPYAGESLTFVNTPLTDVSITINSQVVGGTASSVTCTPDGPNGTTTVGTGDGTFSDTNLVPQTITCTIVIDP
jgi:hypothetical protein